MTTSSADEEHLRLLGIFHYIVGGIAALFACLPLVHVGLGLAMIFAPQVFGQQPGQQPPPAFVGWLFTLMGGVFVIVGQALAVCMILSGRFLRQRKRHTFIFVMACVECVFMPFGTVLGVFTILVLSRPSVKELFGKNGAAMPSNQV